MANNGKKKQQDNAMVILDERIENAIYRVIMVCGLIVAVIGLEVWAPMPQVDGLGFIAIGFLSIALCLHKIGKTNAVIAALTKV